MLIPVSKLMPFCGVKTVIVFLVLLSHLIHCVVCNDNYKTMTSRRFASWRWNQFRELLELYRGGSKSCHCHFGIALLNLLSYCLFVSSSVQKNSFILVLFNA